MGFNNIHTKEFKRKSVEDVLEGLRWNIPQKIEGIRYSNANEATSIAFNQLFIQARAKDDLMLEGKCYVGISANPVLSLQAHNIEYHDWAKFLCIDIPYDKAQECKKAVMDIDGYESMADDDSDYIDESYPLLCLYIYRITEDTVQRIDTSGFVPMMKVPERPVIVDFEYIDGSTEKIYYDDVKVVCTGILAKLEEKLRAQCLAKLRVTHRETNLMEFEFGTDGCIISYDNHTSQAGGYQSYRSGEKSRKLVKLFTGEYPEYMVCRDFEIVKSILEYFVLKGKKPGKRQNVKWVNAKR